MFVDAVLHLNHTKYLPSHIMRSPALLLGYLPVILLASLVAANQNVTGDSIPFETRAYWMRRANEAVADVSGSPCPFAGFGTVIVNHTSTEGIGELVCIGANQVRQTGNPSLHGKSYLWPRICKIAYVDSGEIAAINNCTAIMTDPHGPFRFTPHDALAEFRDLTLYTNAESCPMVYHPIPHPPSLFRCIYGINSSARTVCLRHRTSRLQRIRLRNLDPHPGRERLAPDPDFLDGGLPGVV